MSTCC